MSSTVTTKPTPAKAAYWHGWVCDAAGWHKVAEGQDREQVACLVAQYANAAPQRPTDTAVMYSWQNPRQNPPRPLNPADQFGLVRWHDGPAVLPSRSKERELAYTGEGR